MTYKQVLFRDPKEGCPHFLVFDEVSQLEQDTSIAVKTNIREDTPLPPTTHLSS